MLKYIFVILLFPLFASAQNNMEKFRDLFKEIEMNAIHYHAQFNHSNEFEGTSIYPFIGIKIDSSFFHLLQDQLEPMDSELKYSVFHAVHRFYLSSHLESFVIREYNDGTRSFMLHYLLFNHHKNDFSHHQILAFNYGDEGSFGNTESWVIDINHDGKKDIITHQWSEQYIGRDAEHFEQDSFLLFILEDDDFKEITIKNKELHEQLEKSFPFYQEPSFSHQAENKLSEYLKEKENIDMYKKQKGNWTIIAGSDKNLEAAKFEIERAVKIIGYDYKYNLDARLFDIYHKNERYYTIITDFKNKNEAEIALLEIKKKFNATAYIIDMDKWCKENKHIKRGVYQCLD